METLTELYAKYREARARLDLAEKDVEEIGKRLLQAMQDANEKRYTDSDGFSFVLQVPRSRRVIKGESPKIIAALKACGLNRCISTTERVNVRMVETAIKQELFPEDEWLAASVQPPPHIVFKKPRIVIDWNPYNL